MRRKIQKPSRIAKVDRFHGDMSGEEENNSGVRFPQRSDPLSITSGRVMDCWNTYFAEPSEFTPENMREFTDSFSELNRIGPTQFGEVYQGKMCTRAGKYDVTVKIWNKKADCLNDFQGRHIFVTEEVMFLRHPRVSFHGNLADVIGYCDEDGVMGIVYDFKSKDSLHNMITKDDFGWMERIKVALKFARLLHYLHNLGESPYIIKNISPLHIMIDDEFNPILFDFGCLSGGIIGELNAKKKLIWNSPGYRDLNTCPAIASPKSDVYAYGVILLGLLSKKVSGKRYSGSEDHIVAVDDWARNQHRSNNLSIVHESLKLERSYVASDALLLTQLGMQCIEPNVPARPTMGEVVDGIMSLNVVKFQSWF